MTVRHSGLTIDWYGYATARLETVSGFVAYTDPGRYGVLDGYRPEDGDLVVVTHDHHYDSEGIRRVARDGATVVVFEAVDAANIDRAVEPVDDLGADYDLHRVAEYDQVDVGTVRARAVPAHNDPEGPHVRENGTPFHPVGFGCGFLLDLDGTTVLWPGDTDALPVHESLFADVFLPPIGGAFTIDRHQAVALAEAIDPGLVVPIHYDTFDALETDAEAFAADVASNGIPVAVPPALGQ